MKKKEFIKSFEDHKTEVSVRFIIKFPSYKLNKYIEEGTLEKKLKLMTTKSISNMNLHKSNNLEIKRYKTINSIIEDYYYVRLEYYQKRKDYLLDKWNHYAITRSNYDGRLTMYINGIYRPKEQTELTEE